MANKKIIIGGVYKFNGTYFMLKKWNDNVGSFYVLDNSFRRIKEDFLLLKGWKTAVSTKIVQQGTYIKTLKLPKP